MRSLIVGGLLLFGFANMELPGQNQTAAAFSPPPKVRSQPAEKNPVKSAVTGGPAAANQPITTEIYSDEAFFDSAKHIGTFTGRVIVKDPRFNVQADKLTVYLRKDGEKPAAAETPEQRQGLQKAVAEGNVGVVREVAGENGGPPTRSVGRADIAIYTTGDGNLELKGSPRVQSGVNTHVATSPETVMLINQSGQLTTRGPSRTEIKQEPKAAEPVKP